MADIDSPIIEDAINQAVESLLPHGAGPVTAVRLVHMLERVAHIAYREGYGAGSEDILTIAEVSKLYGVATGTIRQFLNRHPRQGRKAGSTWLMQKTVAERIWGDDE